MFTRTVPTINSPQWEGVRIGSHKDGFWQKAERYSKPILHATGHCFKPVILGAKFVIENPWTVGSSVINGARYVANATKEVFGVSNDQYLLGPARLISGGTVLMKINTIAHSIFDFFKGNWNEKIDNSLVVISEVGAIGDAISTFAQGLESVGAVAAKSILWATPLLIVSMGLEVAGIALGLKGLVETHFLASKLFKGKKAKECTIDDYHEAMCYMEKRREKERFFDRKFFKADQRLGDRLSEIEVEAENKLSSSDPRVREQGANLIRRTVSALKGRLTARIISYAVGIVAAITCLVGLTILLAVPSLQPLGFALLAVGITLSLGRCGYDFVSDYRFKKHLGLNNMKAFDFSIFPKAKKKKKKQSNEAFKLEPIKDKHIKQHKLAKVKKMYHEFTSKVSAVSDDLLGRLRSEKQGICAEAA